MTQKYWKDIRMIMRGRTAEDETTFGEIEKWKE